MEWCTQDRERSLTVSVELGVPGDFPKVAVPFVYAEGDDGELGVHGVRHADKT